MTQEVKPTDPKPTETYSEFVTEHGLDLEIRGESFDEPIRQTDSVQLHTRLQVFEVGLPVPFNQRFFEEKSNKDELKILVQWMKENPKLLKPQT